MNKIRSLAILAVILLILQTMIPYLSYAQEKSSAGETNISVITVSETDIHWQVKSENLQETESDKEFHILFGEGQAHQAIDVPKGVTVQEAANGYQLQVDPDAKSFTIDLTTKRTDLSSETVDLTVQTNDNNKVSATASMAESQADEASEEANDVEEDEGKENVENTEDEADTEEIENEKQSEVKEEKSEEKQSKEKEQNKTKSEEEGFEEEEILSTHKKGKLPNITPFAIGSIDQGEVALDKKATPGDSHLEWNIELQVEGKDIEQESYDIVLVFDRSNSMNEAGRERSAKEAATEFAENLLDGTNSNIRLGVVPFGSDTSGNSAIGRTNLTTNAQQVINGINSIVIGPSYSDGGTHISAGLARGKQMLSSSQADHKIIVLFSDGEPTYSYRAGDYDKPYNNWSDGSSRYDFILKNFGRTEGNGLAGNRPDYGLDPFSCGFFCTDYRVRVRDHIIPTISHAHQEIMGAGIDMYSIGFMVAGIPDAQYTLRNSQNLGYYDANNDNVSDIFNQISSTIKYAATNAYVDDAIGNMFTIVPDSLRTSHGKSAVYDQTTKQIKWNIGSVKETDGSYRLNYKVLLACTDDPQLGVEYPTNEFATLFYQSPNDQQAQKDFPKPHITAETGKINKIGYRVNAAGDPVDANGNVVSLAEAEQFYDELHEEDVEPGDYHVDPGETPEGFIMHDNFSSPASLTVDAVCHTVHFGYVKTGQFQIEKQDAENSDLLLSGATFQVTGPNGEDKGVLTTGEDGKVTSPSWPEGEYSLEEIEAPTGYQITSDEPITVVIDGNQSSPEHIIITNERVKGKIKLIKVDEADTNIFLEGATFNLKLGNEIVDRLVTDENGLAVSKLLPIGDYTLEEVEAPDGYELVEGQELSVTITADETLEYTVVNKKLSGKIKIIKEDADTSESLQGAVFEIKDNDGRLLGTMETDENGVAISDQLPIGDYSLREIEAPYGYELDDTPIEITVQANETTTWTVTNKRLLGDVLLVKEDADDGRLLSGATFAIFNEQGQQVGEEKTTNDEGEIIFEQLPVGKYHVVETKAPTGYILRKVPIHFEITPEQLEAELTITNKKQGWEIPETGGFGPVGFYMLGLLCMAGVLTVAWRKRRIIHKGE